jgi:hypothetical protein
MRTIDRTVSALCNRIDILEDEVKYWKEKYELEVIERNKNLTEQHDRAIKGVANALMFAMSVKDDENGNLVISAEDRKMLAENYK